MALEKSMEWGDKIPIGIFYKEEKPDFHDKIDFLKAEEPLVDRDINIEKICGFMNDFR